MSAGEHGAGTVVSIHLTPSHGAAMVAVKEARAVAGRGLEGDRFFQAEGAATGGPKGPPRRNANVGIGGKPDREITLIEVEAIEALNRDWDLDLDPGDARRNIVTRGVSLNALVGRAFKVGAVTLRGLKPCDPCAHLAKLTRREVLEGLAHRGGLRAGVVTDGIIRVGDAVRVD